MLVYLVGMGTPDIWGRCGDICLGSHYGACQKKIISSHASKGTCAIVMAGLNIIGQSRLYSKAKKDPALALEIMRRRFPVSSKQQSCGIETVFTKPKKFWKPLVVKRKFSLRKKYLSLRKLIKLSSWIKYLLNFYKKESHRGYSFVECGMAASGSHSTDKRCRSIFSNLRYG